jgi:hypothetical protein
MGSYNDQQPRLLAGAPGAGRWTGTPHACDEIDTLDTPAPDQWTPYEHASDVWADGPWDIRIRGTRDMEEALQRVSEANGRLERAGITDRFTLERSRPLKLIEHGRPTTSWMVRLNRPVISYKGWSFASELEYDASGAIISHASVPGHVPDIIECEHCHTSIARTKTYMLIHEDGTEIQVGSTCVQNYLGIRPKGLWSLDAALIDEYGVDEPIDDAEEDTSYSASFPVLGRQDEVPARAVLAAALDITSGGTNWVRREDTREGVGTSDIVKQEIKDFGGHWEDGANDPRIDDVIRAVDDMPGDTEYAQNLKKLAHTRVISYKHAGLLASAVTVYARRRRAERAPAPATPGFIAEEGQKVPETEATVMSVHEFHGYDTYKHREATTRMVIMRDPSGHAIKWTTGSRNVPEEGARVRLTGGRVKGHGNYKGEDQSVVTRRTFDPIDA